MRLWHIMWGEIHFRLFLKNTSHKTKGLHHLERYEYHQLKIGGLRD